MKLAFHVNGQPVPKARARVTSSGHAYTPARTAAWEETVGWAAKVAMKGLAPFQGPLDVTLWFYGARANADIDNLAKSVLDAGNGILYEDDKQVAELRIHRVTGLGEQGVKIEVTTKGELQ